MMSLAICSWEGESNDETEPGELPQNDFTCILQALQEGGCLAGKQMHR